MPSVSSQKENQREKPWWIQTAHWLWKVAGFLGASVLLSLLVNILSTWLTSPQGIIPANSPFDWLVAHWPITVLASCLLLLMAGVSWVLSREQRDILVTISLAQQNRTRMLLRLRRSYRDLLAQSLRGMVWMELGLSEHPDALLNANTLLLRSAKLPEHLLPVDTTILSAYDQAGHELLILGAPGAGKSSLLLRLALQLTERAETDTAHPMPIILPLSSWAVKKKPLQDWLSEQLTQIYNVPRRLSEHWVQEEAILPLLDGLDEMDASSYSDCIVAINAYHHDHMTPLVVSSRIAEYEIVSRELLSLQSAVVVQPLTYQQVDEYLTHAGKPLAALRRAIKKNSALQDLATIPLMLGILMLTYQGTAIRELPGKQAQLQEQVWKNYVEHMVVCKGDEERYSLRRTCSWLSWLARQMRDHNQTVFYLEHLQPSCLTGRQQLTYKRLAIRLPALLTGVLAGLFVTLLLFNFIDPASLVQFGVMGGLLGWLFWEPTTALPKQERGLYLQGYPRLLVKNLPFSIIIGLAVGLSFGLDLGYGPSDWLRDGSLFGVVIGLSSFLLCCLLPICSEKQALPSIKRGSGPEWKVVLRHLQGKREMGVLLVMASMGVSYGLCYGLCYGLPYGLGDGLFYGLSFGLVSILLSLVLQAQAENIALTERLRWTWKSLVRSLFTKKHVQTTFFLACTIAVAIGLSYGLLNWLSYGAIIGMSYGLSLGLSYGFSYGLLYWILLGLFQGIASERIEDHFRQITNQGIRRSWRNSLLMALISSGSMVAISTLGNVLSFGLSDGLRVGLDDKLRLGMSNWSNAGLNHGLIYGLSHGLNYGLHVGYLVGLCGGLLVWNMHGGLAIVRHYTIRLLLYHSHIFPWHVQAFLDDATTRILLRQVGGGYSFVHRLLLDHIADTYQASALEKAGEVPSGQASVTPFL